MHALGNTRDRVGESPLWSAAEQALYRVDIEGRAILRLRWPGGREQRWSTTERVGCIVLRDGGGLVAAMESGIFAIDLPEAAPSAQETLLAAVAFPADGMRFNDGRCDREGRLWVSSMVRDMAAAQPAGALYRFDARGLSAPLVTGLIVGNGLAFTDRGEMYLSDSHPSRQCIWRYTLDADGTPGARHDFADMTPLPGRPDGAALDDQGGYWICANDAGQVHRFHPDGRLDRSIAVPVSKPSMCAFGGPGLDLMFITSITPAQPVAGFDASLDGAVFVTRPGARGVAEVPLKLNPSGDRP